MTAAKKQIVVLDVMGADNHPDEIIQGGIIASRSAKKDEGLVLVGDEEIIRRKLDSTDDCSDNISVVHAEQVVPMDIAATEGARMKQSSVSVGLRLIKDGKADAFVSPSNTGAVMASSLLTLGRVKGVPRPAIAALFPTSLKKPCVVLDAGANADCRPQHLVQFGIMGSVYASIILEVKSPRVGLLSIGEERSKGNDLIFSASKLLQESKIKFVGNIEGRDILSGAVEVAVTDGFTGNILLKFAESIQPWLVASLQRQIRTNIFSRVGVTMMLPFMRRMQAAFDYSAYGGAPLLGVNGVVMICHGASSDAAIANAVSATQKMVRGKLKDRLHQALSRNQIGTDNESKEKSKDYRDGLVCASAPDDQR
ncbi:MAG: phosphate acyltransferase PlsX [candidate division Zixibacteria bacterium]